MGTLVIGTAFVDVKGFPFDKPGVTGCNLGTVKVAHGGVGRNVAENFANVGMPVEFVGLLDDTAFGRDVEHHLRDIGVGLTRAPRVPERGVGIWTALFDDEGNLTRSVSQMPDIGLLEEHLQTHLDPAVEASDGVVLEIDLNERIAEMVIDAARRHGRAIYVVVGNMSVAANRPDLLGKTSCFICNAAEAAKLFGRDELASYSPEQMLGFLPTAAEDLGVASLVVTMGEHGAAFYENGTVGLYPAIPTKVVDTTGAGDAFFSGTVMALLRGLPLSEATAYGTKLASATISWYEATCPVSKGLFD